MVPNNLKEYTPDGIKGRLSTIRENNVEFKKLYDNYINSGGDKKDVKFMMKPDGSLTANSVSKDVITFVKSKKNELMEKLNMLKQKYNGNVDAIYLITFYESNIRIILDTDAAGFKKNKKTIKKVKTNVKKTMKKVKTNVKTNTKKKR